MSDHLMSRDPDGPEEAGMMLGLIFLHCMTGQGCPESWDDLRYQTCGVELAINIIYGAGTPGHKQSMELLERFRRDIERWSR